MKQPRLNKPAFQERQRLLLAEQQARGIPLIQRRSDGVYVARSKSGREEARPYRDRSDNAPYK